MSNKFMLIYAIYAIGGAAISLHYGGPLHGFAFLAFTGACFWVADRLGI